MSEMENVMTRMAKSCSTLFASDWSQHVQPTVVLIPAVNKARFIGSLVLAVRSYVDEVVVIDDGSCDNTAALAECAGATIIRHAENQGKATSIYTGLTYAQRLNPFVVILLDVDAQQKVHHIPHLIAQIAADQSDLVVLRSMGIMSVTAPSIAEWQRQSMKPANLEQVLCAGDLHNGMWAFSGSALHNLFIHHRNLPLELGTQLFASEYQLRLVEVSIDHNCPETVHKSLFKNMGHSVNSILQLVGEVRPLLYLSGLGLMMLVLGGLLGLRVMEDYAASQTLTIGYVLLTVVLGVIGISLFFAGLVLHSMRGMIHALQRSLGNKLAQEAGHDYEQLRNVPQHVTNVGQHVSQFELEAVFQQARAS